MKLKVLSNNVFILLSESKKSVQITGVIEKKIFDELCDDSYNLYVDKKLLIQEYLIEANNNVINGL